MPNSNDGPRKEALGTCGDRAEPRMAGFPPGLPPSCRPVLLAFYPTYQE